jgi:Subtilase family
MSNDDVGDYVYTLVPELSSRQIGLVRAGTDPTEAVANANRVLTDRGSGWRVSVEEPGTHAFVIPLVLEHTPPPGSRPVPEHLDVLGLMPELQALLDPLLVGTVAYKPGALTRGDHGRVPVSVRVGAPPRRPAGGRRPVVAILDTDVAAHEWWDGDRADDRFCVDARERGWNPGPRLPNPADAKPASPTELGEQEGHGTFTAGLVRQIAPDAQVLAVHTIADDGVVQGDHVLNALEWVRGQLREGDVVCLPFGFHPMLPADRRYLDWLAVVLGRLANAGVTVAAAAGNDGEDDPVYPAAFAASTGTPEQFRIRSVGAVNVRDDGTRAYYSNGGNWVTRWEVGTSLVSTFPAINAVGAAEFDLPAKNRPRRSADPDDFSGGFARWSGTSFAAAIHAARIAAGAA